MLFLLATLVALSCAAPRFMQDSGSAHFIGEQNVFSAADRSVSYGMLFAVEIDWSCADSTCQWKTSALWYGQDGQTGSESSVVTLNMTDGTFANAAGTSTGRFEILDGDELNLLGVYTGTNGTASALVSGKFNFDHIGEIISFPATASTPALQGILDVNGITANAYSAFAKMTGGSAKRQQAFPLARGLLAQVPSMKI